jgi:hypothetical protein
MEDVSEVRIKEAIPVAPAERIPSPMDRVWDFFISVKLAIFTLIILAVASIFGTIFVAVPDDDVAVEVEIRLEDGTRNELLLEPIYGTGVRPTYGICKLLFGKRGPNFCSHLTRVRLLMNGKLL